MKGEVEKSQEFENIVLRWVYFEIPKFKF